MSFTDDEIDKIVQDAAAKVEVPYQDSYWAEMEALLPVTSKKKPFWWLFSVIFALVGLATTLFLFSPKESSSDKQLQANLKSSASSTSAEIIATDSNASINTSNTKDQDKNGFTAETSENNSNQQGKIGDAAEMNSKQSKATNHVVNTLNSSSTTTVDGNANYNKDTKANQRTSASGLNTSATNENNAHRQGANSGKNQKANKQTSNVLLAEAQNSSNNKQAENKRNEGIDNKSTKANSNSSKLANQQGTNQTEVNTRVIQKEESTVGNQLAKNEVVNNEVAKSELADKEKLKNELARNEKSKAIAEGKEVLAEDQGDSLKHQAQNANLADDKTVIKEAPVSSKSLETDIQQPVTTGSYYVQTGMRFSQSYLKTASGQMMTGVLIGAGYQLIRPGFGYSVGINATSYFVQNMEIVRKARVYGFGVTNYQQNLKYKQLTYLELPINLNFIDVNNTYTVGIAPTYLMSTMMSFTERQDVQILNERNYYGQKVGLKSVGLNAMVGYQRIIKNNWSIGVNVGISLLQQIDGDQFYDKSVAMPLHGQITLRKTLIPKR